MGPTIEALHRLQVIESELAEIRRQRDAKTRRIDACTRKVAQAEQSLSENRLKYRQQQVRLDAIGLDVASREETIAHHRTALSTAKTNREYASILTAMNTEKADNAKLETGMLQLMDEIQATNAAGESIEAERAKLLEQVARVEAAQTTFDEQSRARREKLEADRAACSDDIAPTALATFVRVAGHHDGEAMAAVVKLSPRRDDHVCSGCNMKITLEVLNALQTRDEIQTCGVCGCILFLERDMAT